MMNPRSVFEQRLFYGLLALLVWLPLPLASNRVWAEAIFEVSIVLLTLLWLWASQRKAVTPGIAFASAKPVLWLLLLWLLYLAFMLLPLPLTWRLILSPESANLYTQAGVNGWAPLSVYPY